MEGSGPGSAHIIEAVCREFGITEADLTGPCRKSKLVDARQMACWLMMRDGAYEDEIAEAVNRALSSVYYSISRAKARIVSDELFGELARRLL